jgi:diguanylate cyclase (GGDEF)-like protein
VVREALTTAASAHLAGGVPPLGPNRHGSAGRGLAGGRLASTILGHLPLGVAVVDAHARLVFWNEHAARLFGAPPVMAADMPQLDEILTGVVNLTREQRDGIVSFATSHIEAGDRTEPEGCLRISLGRDRRFTIQVRGIGYDRWMLVIDDGRRPATPGHSGAVTGSAVAWLDALTGLSNRRHFNQMLRELMANASPDAKHAVLMVDLDRFKIINDTLGHSVGDALLCLVAQRLRRETRDEDLLARLGGDEFVILPADGERADRLAARVVDILSRPFLVEGHIANIGASVGISRIPEHGASADDVIRYAELALYEAKSAGRQTWRLYDPAMATRSHARRDLEAGLRKALAMNELSLAYQPRLDVQTRTLSGFEALLRWNPPTLGGVSPVLFIPLDEEVGCIVAVGEWVLRTACTEAARWPAPLAVAVSVSPRRLEDGEKLFNAVEAALEASGLAGERLELEISKSSLLSSVPNVRETLNRLRARGVRIAMGDLSTGNSAPRELRSFPFNKIKIDQSFIAGLRIDNDTATMIRAIVALGAGLGIATVAEGVQTADQAPLVGADGCTHAQGHLVSRPIPAAEIDAFLVQYIPMPDRISTK